MSHGASGAESASPKSSGTSPTGASSTGASSTGASSTGASPTGASPTGATPSAPAELTARGRATRAKLLEAAARAFSEYGYTGTRVADIVRFAELSHGAFYRYFENKEQALVAVLRPKMDELRAASRGVDPSLPEPERLVQVTTRFFSRYALDRRLYAVVREAVALDTAGIREAWLGERQLFVEPVSRWITSLVEAGRAPAPPSARLLAEALGAMTEQLAYVHIALAPSQPRPEEIDALARSCAAVWHVSIFQPPRA